MSTAVVAARRKHSVARVLSKDFKRNYFVYLMVIPVVAYYVIFSYWPMYGLQIAFKDFNIVAGYGASPWSDPIYKHFLKFFNGIYFWRTLRNTLLINIYGLMFSFPLSIVFALLLNEVRSSLFKRTIQTISYLPYFISMVVICGIITDFCLSDGLINSVIALFGGKRSALLQQSALFRTVYIASDIWQYLGWNSIIYFAALAGIDPELYQAAIIDGAGRFRQMWHITLPGIKPTIVILLILSFGSMLSVGSEKIILLYNPATYETADVISSYVYRNGLQRLDWSYGSAVGMFNSVINVILLVIANRFSRIVGETSLW